MTRLELHGWLGAGLTACFAACQAVPLGEMPSPPEKWGRPVGSYDGADECPDIGGRYSLSAEKISNDAGAVTESVTDALSFYSIFVGPVDTAASSELSGIVKTDSGIVTDEMRIDQAAPGSFTMTFLMAEKSKSVSYLYDSKLGHFTCQDGFVLFPLLVNTTGSQGKTFNYQYSRKMQRMDDGSLLVYQQKSAAKSLLGGTESYIHTFYRFTPLPAGD